MMKHKNCQSYVFYITVFVGIILALVSTSIHAEPHRILNRDGIFDSLEVCGAYDIFLDGGLSNSTDGCDEMTAFLIESGDISLHKFVSEYHKQFPIGSNFELLLYAVEIVDQKRQSFAYNNFRIAQNHLFGGFYYSGDKERASLYGVLIERLAREILSAELPSNSKFLSEMPTTDLASRLGFEFNILNGNFPYTELVCFLTADNLRVPVRKVASSTKLHRCIAKYELDNK